MAVDCFEIVFRSEAKSTHVQPATRGGSFSRKGLFHMMLLLLLLLHLSVIIGLLVDRGHGSPWKPLSKVRVQPRRPAAGTRSHPPNGGARLREHSPTTSDGYLTPAAAAATTTTAIKLPSRPDKLDLDLDFDDTVKPFLETVLGHVYEPTPDSPPHVYETIAGAEEPYYLDIVDGPPKPPARDSDVQELRRLALSSRDRAVEAENDVGSALEVDDIEEAMLKADRAAEEAFRSAQELGLLKGAGVDMEKQRMEFDAALRATVDARMAAARARSRAATLMIDKCFPERNEKWALITRMASMRMEEAVHYQQKMEEAARQLNEQISRFHQFTKELSRRQGSLIASWLSEDNNNNNHYIKLWSERDIEAINREKQFIDVVTEMSKSALKELWEAAVTALDLSDKFTRAIESARERARQEEMQQAAKDAKERQQKEAMALAEKQREARLRRELEAEAKKEATSLMEKLQGMEEAKSTWWTDLMIGVTTAISTVPFGIFLYAVVTSSSSTSGLGAAAVSVATSMAADTTTAMGAAGAAAEEAVSQVLEDALGTAEAALVGLSHPVVSVGADTESILSQMTSESLPHIMGEMPVVSELADSVRHMLTTTLRRRTTTTTGTTTTTTTRDEAVAALLRRDEALRGMVVDAVMDVMQEAIQGAHVAMFGEEM
ncbi:hypothetical protein L249_2956 [Ophiocordyceps polyrhachis-furcata BCC 54312]|uniref:Uncharacterized protein n=1 Tax=Ophiocordyceps polyrhachis-furcata BCC 54312 TaxID=1330021 RepID=A0A367LQ71_9HYPO|nr:hypothetical protein L249_2956 [Ophiocordyceps polyrhachis-furcata BCC 54312]